VADVFFSDEDFDWWGDVAPGAGAAPAVAVPGRRPRRPPRTLASDLRRLQAGFDRRSPVPAAMAGLLALALVAALAVVVRLSLGGEEATTRAEPAAVTTPAPLATAPPTPTPAKTVLLKPGATGAQVRDLQASLTELGHMGSADGDYGPGTSAAVAGFQASRGLTADGVAGQATAEALRQALSERADEDAAAAGAGIDAAAEQGRLGPEAAAAARAAVAAAVESIRVQSPGRAAVLGSALHDVAAFAGSYSASRAALFEELGATVRALAKSPAKIARDRVFDGSGVVYRSFPDQGYRFHPLANFVRLDHLAERGRREAVRKLAPALVARGVRSGNALLWEYRFRFGGSPDVWTSGFAQVVGAQALAKAGKLLGDRTLTAAAAAAFRAAPRDLTLAAGGGDWIQEYSYSDLAVLNADLQSIVSLLDYVDLTGNEDARAYAARLDETARSALGRFDTGCWSLYSFGGKPATLEYHTYHVDLLEQLAARTGAPVYRDAAERWRGYLDAGGC
jgi:D-glucuronyl C5-epimerase C-terminus/Putative peptidoglycan binding domain